MSVRANFVWVVLGLVVVSSALTGCTRPLSARGGSSTTTGSYSTDLAGSATTNLDNSSGTGAGDSFEGGSSGAE